MKKKFIFFIITVLLAIPFFAEENSKPKNQNFTFSIKPFLGTAFGKYGEYVFSWDDNYVCSYLEWNVTPLIFAGTRFDFKIKNFEIDFSASSGLPLKCGKMYDSDWNGDGVKTTYSIHENHAALNLDFDVILKYNFQLGRFTLSPVFQSEIEYNSFHTKNGHGWYGGSSYNTSGIGDDVSWDSPYAKHYRVSKIDLNRLDVYTFLGFEFNLNIFNRILISAATYFSPYTFCQYSDHHYDGTGNGNDFYLNSNQHLCFLRFKEKFGLQFNLTKYWDLNLDVSWLFGSVKKGLLSNYEQNGGSDINIVKISFGIEKSW